MTAPPYIPDSADVELVDLIDRAWRNAPCPKCGRVKACRCLLGDEELRKYRARAVVAALADAGRLLPSDTDTRTETATIFGGATSQRTVRTLADGWTLAGPWRPVPSTPIKELPDE